MIRRTLDSALLNAVANTNEVRPLLGGVGPIDVSAIVQDLTNFALVTDLGGFLLIKHEPGIYESHTIFPVGSGQHALDAIRQGLRWMFTRTDCERVVTKVATDNRAASTLVRQVGFTQQFARAGGWIDTSGAAVAGVYFALDLDRWLQSDDVARHRGAQFHDELEVAKAASGSSQPIHDHDPAHDQAVGAAVLMIEAGAPQKGVQTYNRWARLAGYQPIDIVTLNPLVIDVRDALVGVHNDTMEVLQCR